MQEWLWNNGQICIIDGIFMQCINYFHNDYFHESALNMPVSITGSFSFHTVTKFIAANCWSLTLKKNFFNTIIATKKMDALVDIKML